VRVTHEGSADLGAAYGAVAQINGRILMRYYSAALRASVSELTSSDDVAICDGSGRHLHVVEGAAQQRDGAVATGSQARDSTA
jgi:hypothetical protein